MRTLMLILYIEMMAVLAALLIKRNSIMVTTMCVAFLAAAMMAMLTGRSDEH